MASSSLSVVLVHGAGGSPATWSLVAPLLSEAGHDVVLFDHLSQSHRRAVADLEAVLDASSADVLLVGHSYGGAVITDAGRHPRARGLVYVAAFAPAEGESIDDIVNTHGRAEVFDEAAPAGPDGVLSMPGGGDDDWRLHSWDVPEAARLAAAATRRPIREDIFTTPAGPPAWRELPSWYLVATQDKHIRPSAQRAMALRAHALVSGVGTSHSAPHAAPERVAALIETALASLAAPVPAAPPGR